MISSYHGNDKHNISRENPAAFWNIILLCILAEGAPLHLLTPMNRR